MIPSGGMSASLCLLFPHPFLLFTGPTVVFSALLIHIYIYFCRDLQDARKKLTDMENKRKNSGEEAERLRNAVQEAAGKSIRKSMVDADAW